jgi:hypothetical protein
MMVDSPDSQEEKELKAKVEQLLAEADSRQEFNDGTDQAMIKQLTEAAGRCPDKGWSTAARNLVKAIDKVKSKSETW